MEAVIIIALIAQRYRLAPTPGSASGPKSVAFTCAPTDPCASSSARETGLSSAPFHSRHRLGSRLCNTHKRMSLCPHFG